VIPLTPAGADQPYREVVVRMRGENGELVLPMAFIPAAERYGVLGAIDRWVVGTAFEWLSHHPAEEGLAINLSSHSLGDEGFLDFVMERFRDTRLSPRRVCFEITETAAIANWNRASHFLAALKTMGCRFALDDFGSGMSSFAYLKSLPVDFIKIDYAMVDAINRIAQVIGIRTIAEYVENEEILLKLRELGVNYAQGNGIHVPQPLERLKAHHAAGDHSPGEDKSYDVAFSVVRPA